MTHLADGLLRRLCDDPLVVDAEAREHLRACSHCRARYATIAETAAAMAALFTAPAQRPDLAAALARTRTRVGPPRKHAAFPGHIRMLLQPRVGRRRISAAIGAAFAALLVTILALTPAGSFAQGFFTIFQTNQFAVVPVTMSDLRTLPNLSQYGTMTMPRMDSAVTVANATAAAARSGQPVLVPGVLPSDVPNTMTYTVLPATTASFTFSADRARAAAAREGKALPPMPASLDGSTLRVTVGPVVLAVYHDAESRLPGLVIAQAPAPRITSTGASEQVILHYLLAQPGISPSLAASIRALGDPATTLPIPIPINLAHGDTVQVRGVSGIAVGDNTGIASGVMWSTDGLVHGVAGTLTEDEVLAIANGLH